MENSLNNPEGLGDVDAVLVLEIERAEAVRPFQGAEAIAVRAIVAYSRLGKANNDNLAQAQARALFVELTQLRK